MLLNKIERGRHMAAISIKEEWTTKPAEKRIFGNFIESGFGRQVNGMWGEMLYNRAFRQVPPMKIATWEWLGLHEEYYNSNAPFWHSGYEENDWKDIGSPQREHTCGTHTFKGMTSLLLRNTGSTVCGLSQEGIHLKKGMRYQFRLFAGVRGNISAAGLNGFGDTIHREDAHILTVTIGGQKTEFALTTVPRLLEWTFEAEREESTAVRLEFSFPGSLVLAFSSLMQADHLGGWRRDVVEKLREAAPSVVRFPGGCFVSFYDWESSIGDRDKREPQPSFYWGGMEDNDVGLDEFLALSALVGFEPQLCFNMMTSEPFKARQMVEYLNAPADTGMGRLRCLNGQEKPYGVRLFEMDNEPGRKWTARQYAEECLRFAEEMRLADPAIQLMLAAYAYPPECLPEILEIAGKAVQYIIYRQGEPAFVQKILPVLRAYNEKNGTDLKLVNTEWLPTCRSIEPFENPAMPLNFHWHGEITDDYATIFATQQISWNYALNGAHRLLDYISYGGEFALANFNNMCNTWGQNIIEATKDSCFLSCMGEVFAMFHRVFEPCYGALADTEDDRLFGVATKTVTGKEQLYLVNHASAEITAALPAGAWTIRAGLQGSGRMVHQTEHSSCISAIGQQSLPNGTISVPPLSFLCLERQ